jgi:hypothetical protein
MTSAYCNNNVKLVTLLLSPYIITGGSSGGKFLEGAALGEMVRHTSAYYRRTIVQRSLATLTRADNSAPNGRLFGAYDHPTNYVPIYRHILEPHSAHISTNKLPMPAGLCLLLLAPGLIGY